MSPKSDRSSTALCDLAPSQLAKLLGSAASFLGQIEEGEGDSSTRQKALGQANKDLAPLVFTPLLEPRTLIVEALREIDARPGLMQAVVSELVRRAPPSLTPITAVVLLELLVSADVVEGPSIALMLANRFTDDVENSALARRQVALIELSARTAGAAPVFSMIERLRRTGTVTHEAAFCALRVLSTWQPDKLRLALVTLQLELEQNRFPIAVLSLLITDLIRRGSRETVLMALTSVDPRFYPRISEAAFVHDRAPFRVFTLFEYDRAPHTASALIEPDEDVHLRSWLLDEDRPESAGDQRLVIGWDGGTVNVADFLQGDAATFWHRALLNVTGLAPASRSERRGMSGGAIIEIGLGSAAALRIEDEAPDEPRLLDVFFVAMASDPNAERQIS